MLCSTVQYYSDMKMTCTRTIRTRNEFRRSSRVGLLLSGRVARSFLTRAVAVLMAAPKAARTLVSLLCLEAQSRCLERQQRKRVVSLVPAKESRYTTIVPADGNTDEGFA